MPASDDEIECFNKISEETRVRHASENLWLHEQAKHLGVELTGDKWTRIGESEQQAV